MRSYKSLITTLFSISCRRSHQYRSNPVIYYLPIFHINRIHFSENHDRYIYSYLSFYLRLLHCFSYVPFKICMIVIKSLCCIPAYKSPLLDRTKARRLLLSYLVKTSAEKKHVFTGIDSSDTDLHLVTSSLYDKDELFDQYIIPDNSNTIHCRTYAPPQIEIHNIISSISSAIVLFVRSAFCNSHSERIFLLNASLQLISLESLIPLRLIYNIRWLIRSGPLLISEAYLTHEGYAWEYAAIDCFCQLNIPVSLYCHAPITPNNLSCFRNLFSNRPVKNVFVPNSHTRKLFLDSYHPSSPLPRINIFSLPLLSNSPTTAPHSTSRPGTQTFLLLPENLLFEVLIFLQFISVADSGHSFILRLHPSTIPAHKSIIQKYIHNNLSHLSITYSRSSLYQDASHSHYALYRSSSAILSTLLHTYVTPVFLDIVDKPCPNPLYFLDSSLFLSCASFSDITSTSFVRPPSSFYLTSSH